MVLLHDCHDAHRPGAFGKDKDQAMKMITKLGLTAAAALLPATAAMAQDVVDTAPDGSRAFGIEPYAGIMGGYVWYDQNQDLVPQRTNADNYEGALVEGVLGVNVPVGPAFAGVEGNVAKGVDGAIDWQYGVRGRVGLRAGETGMIYGLAGYEWVNFKKGLASVGQAVDADRDFGSEVYGLGVEVGPREIGLGGLTGESGARLRLEVTTNDFESVRPMAGVVFHF